MKDKLPMGLIIADVIYICSLARETAEQELDELYEGLEEWLGNDLVPFPIISPAIVRHVIFALERTLQEKAASPETPNGRLNKA